MLLSTGMAIGQESELLFLAWIGTPLQLDRRTEGAPFTEAEQRPKATAHCPSRTGHHGDLQAQGKFPAGWVCTS
jgi:hypothetical protein